MRVLFLSPRQCWPLVTGASLREYHLARRLATKADVTILAFASPSLNGHLEFLEEVVTVVPPQRYTLAKLIRGAVGSTPISVLNYTTGAMRRALSALLRQKHFDVVQIEGTPMAGYARLISESPDRPVIVYDWHNIESELMGRFATQTPGWPRRFYAQLTARRLCSLEADMLRSGAAHIVCSQRERDQLRRVAPDAVVELVPNGVDGGSFSRVELDAANLRFTAANGTANATPNRLVFVGSMNYHANIEAAEQFVRNIWPDVFRDFPDSRLTLVGSSPSSSVRDLANVPGVEVTGTVADIRPYYAQAAISIVPLLTGGGTRLKILEAMAAGVPVISSGVGAEGLDVTSGEDILIADSIPEWRAAITRLLTDPAAARTLASAARENIVRRYDWDAAGEALIQVYETLLARRAG